MRAFEYISVVADVLEAHMCGKVVYLHCENDVKVRSSFPSVWTIRSMNLILNSFPSFRKAIKCCYIV